MHLRHIGNNRLFLSCCSLSLCVSLSLSLSLSLYLFLYVIAQTAGVNNNRVDCVKANELCTSDSSCSSKYRTFRQCLAGSSSMVTGPQAKNECINAMEALQQSPLYDCRCKRGMKNEKRCLRIYWSIHQSFMHGRDGYPSVRININSCKNIFILGGAEPLGTRGNNCLDAAKACNLNDNCKKFRTTYVSPCTTRISASEICNRRKCHKALRHFFDRVPPKYSYGMLFCSCRNTACTERRRQTIVPICSYQEKEKPNCLSLAESCQTNYICRSRLADFFTNCQSESRTVSGCLRENYAGCLLAYTGLIGTFMTPNYIDSQSISVAPWCSCSGSGNRKEDCDELLNFFMHNRCFQNAVQAFGNGTDVNLWQHMPPAQTTTPFRLNDTPQSNTEPASQSNAINTANDPSVIPICANLQAQRLHSNASVSQELCISETPITASKEETVDVQPKGRTSPDSSSASSIGIRVSEVLCLITIVHSAFHCFYSSGML
uniref:GDNF family receptor alpha-1 n=1 Tax=Callorhinchus milii TaxID=7868 RepID=A0A4W3JJJ2_CALMI